MRLGVIGGTGSSELFPAGTPVDMPAGASAQRWGSPSAALRLSLVEGHEILFISRHGSAGQPAIPPHRVNYRANLWALRAFGVDHVIGINAVGGIAPWATPGRLVVPDQLIDYTWGREHTYTGDGDFPLVHVEFTTPFTPTLREHLLVTADRQGLDIARTGTYGATQGPRLETSAEIDRLERDGCHVVGMTAMPEAGLARELDLSYAICCVVVNHAAGRGDPGTTIHAQIEASLASGMSAVRRLITGLVALPAGAGSSPRD